MADELFDYVVIGAGSAGCAAAGRLSEDGRRTLLLLEAGGRNANPWIHVPVGYGKTFNNELLTWRFSTEPAPGVNGRSLFTPSGRVLGGSSSINGLVYIRGAREDFNDWRQDGNVGWGRAGSGCLDSAPRKLSGFLPGYAERGALRFCRGVGRA